ncbi:MAG: DsbA family protein [Ketobacteraceae bacterium]|nr:DsbA family protein [Ketobacteraceae bacterium]
MGLKTTIVPWLANFITSDSLRNLKRGWFEVERRLIPSLNTVVFYHRVDDPYSFLLLQAIPRFLEDFKVNLEIRLVLDLPEEMNPEPEKWRAYALRDARRLAKFHGLSFSSDARFPSYDDALKATSILLKHINRPKLLHLVSEVTGALWGTSTTTFESCVRRYGMMPEAQAKKRLKENKEQLLKAGHYTSAMLYYGYEWYWGMDRLGHLAERLNKPGIRRDTGETADYQKQYKHLLQGYNTLRPRPRQVQTLEFYFSFRSPYSYVAAERVFKLVELYKIPLEIKPVMPMVTRGIPAPKLKRTYIVHDAKREANRFDIPFGKICDPLGEGVNNCMALFTYARQQGKDKEFIAATSTGIWAQGMDMSQPGNLRKIIKKIGLDWNQAKAHLTADWQPMAEGNRNDLEALGLWGVPSFRYGDLVIWGQDRLWALEDAILSATSDTKKPPSAKRQPMPRQGGRQTP